MGEGYPQGPEQQLPPQEQEQPQQADEGFNSVETTEPGTVDQSDAPETRWDHDKAETMAAVLKDDGEFDGRIKEREHSKDWFTSEEYIDDHTGRESHGLKAAKAGAEYTDDYDGYQAQQTKPLPEAQKEYDDAVAETVVKGQEGIEKSRQRLEKVVDKVLSPYQELYDRNPAVFAEMPTSEFMVIAKELAEVGSKIEGNEINSETLAGYNDKLRTALEQKTSVNWDFMEKYSRELAYSLDMSNEEWSDMREKFEAEIDDSFDKTRRQIMEGYVRVGEEYTSQFEAKKQADELRSKELLDKYGPETPDQDQI